MHVHSVSIMAEKNEANLGAFHDPEKHVDLQNTPKPDNDQSSDEELVTVEAGYSDVLVELPPDEAKRALRKVDYRLIPLLAFLYLVAFVDRANIGNAKIAGMEEDLKLVGSQYNIAVTMFFVTYVRPCLSLFEQRPT